MPAHDHRSQPAWVLTRKLLVQQVRSTPLGWTQLSVAVLQSPMDCSTWNIGWPEIVFHVEQPARYTNETSQPLRRGPSGETYFARPSFSATPLRGG